MEKRSVPAEFEDRIKTTLMNEPAVWTPECLEPDVLIGLIEQGGDYPDAGRLMAHAATCGNCRREYGEMRQTLKLADMALKAQLRTGDSRGKRSTKSRTEERHLIVEMVRLSLGNSRRPPRSCRDMRHGTRIDRRLCRQSS